MVLVISLRPSHGGARSGMLSLAVVVLALGACGVDTPSADMISNTSAGDAAAEGRQPQGLSLLGEPLYAPRLSPETRAEREAQLAQARAQYQQNPRDESNIIWLGRRLAYLGRYKDAIAVYRGGLAEYPNSYKLRRHRGHRFITLRRFDDAIGDLSRAAELIQGRPDEIEPDGLPNPRNIPTSTSHSNIYYHLGLAHYLKGEIEDALEAYRRCMDFATNNDMRCATSYWLYLTLDRLGRDDEAMAVLEHVTADLEIIENFAYHKLLLLYQGELTPQQVRHSLAALSPARRGDAPAPTSDAINDATIAYGLGAWHLIHGRTTEASGIFKEITSGSAWPAFGHLAAEAELARGGMWRGAVGAD